MYLGADGRYYPNGGNVMLNGNLEMRFPLPAGFGGVTFYDFGNVYRLLEDVDFSDFQHALGVGIRYATPLGPLRLDFGRSLRTSDSQFYFTFGHAF
jgi:outer membrane translocation and assembly module TamA